MAIKTTWTEVNQIIKEEFQRLVEKKKIQSRIQQINEELAQMEEDDQDLMGEDEHLEEVEAGGLEKLDSDTGLKPNFKFAAKFDKKGSHLLEDEDSEEEGEDEEGSLADEFAELGAAIEAKIMAALGKAEEGEEDEEGDDEEGEKVEDEDFEEVEVEDEVEDEEPIEEYAEQQPSTDMDGDGDVDADDVKMQSESLNESVSRNNKKYLNVLSEGLDTRRKNALESEIERMRRLARLGNND